MILINIVDSILFVLMLFSVLYLLIFAIASLNKKKIQYPETDNKLKYVILFPAYKEDKVIVSSVKSFLAQDYPKSYFDVVVISDQLKDETNEELSQLPIKLLIANYEDSTKAKALIFALDNLSKDNYDVVAIIDADNTVSANRCV